ncbi:MAG: GDSL-type esterase/lipase family protein [Chthoniobacteraceae bacterium]
MKILAALLAFAFTLTAAFAEHEGKIQILLLGDSTAEAKIPKLLAPQEPQLEDLISQLLAAEGLPPTHVINLGLSGEYIRRLIDSGRYDKEVPKLPGLDYILIRYGLNDQAKREGFAENFGGDFSELLAKLRHDHPHAVLIPTTVIPFKDETISAQINALIRQVAAKEKLALFDLYPRYAAELKNGANMLNYRRLPLEKVPGKLREFAQPFVLPELKSVVVLDNRLDAHFGELPGWFSDRHPNLAGYHVIADETAKYLAPLLRALPPRVRVAAGRYDIKEVRDAATLETRVIEDWHPWARDAAVRQKLVEITVCEWWPGQKVRLPVTLLAPATGGPCQNVIVGNAGMDLKAAAPAGAMLRLLKENGVGLALIGMTTVDAMPPLGLLDVGMKEHFLKTKDARFTPAWIWGLSDMRALTAAIAEKEIFQPVKVIATGGSKRGVATAAAGIADDRFTAIMPVVAPIIDPPGGPYVEGLQRAEIVKANEHFLADLAAGKITTAPTTAVEPLIARDKIRAAERITVAEARGAGWTDDDMRAASSLTWEVCRTTNYLPALKKRGVEIFYNQGSNDNVSPGLRELGRRFPELPIYVVPGGQHGGAKTAGFLKQVGSLPEVDENLLAFAQHHFINARPLVATPRVTTRWDAAAHCLKVAVTIPDKAEPQKNDVWWSVNRHADYTFAMEFDAWESAPLRQTGPATFAGEVNLPNQPETIDLLTVHQHTANGSTLTLSSPLLRIEPR